MRQLGGAPERPMELSPASPGTASLCGGRRDREVPWGTGPAGPHEKGALRDGAFCGSRMSHLTKTTVAHMVQFGLVRAKLP